MGKLIRLELYSMSRDRWRMAVVTLTLRQTLNHTKAITHF